MNAAIAFLIACLFVAGTLERPALSERGESGPSGAVPGGFDSQPMPKPRSESAAEGRRHLALTVAGRGVVGPQASREGLGAVGGARLTTIRRLKRGPLARHAHRIEAAGWRHGVSPFAIVAISGVESSYGRYPCRSNPRNIWGLGACGRAWTVPYFDTWQEAFDYQARFLRRTWPRARTVYDLHGYCTCSGWGVRVASLMRTHYSAGPGVRYPGMKAA